MAAVSDRQEIPSLRAVSAGDPTGLADGEAVLALNALPQPVLIVELDGKVSGANTAAEMYFQMGLSQLCRSKLADLVGFSSPIANLPSDVLERRATVSEHRVDLELPRNSGSRIVDVQAAAFGQDAQKVIITLQERTIAEKIDKQLNHRGAARSVTALASMLAHEIKNPLSGIRGAAQLLEMELGDAERALTRLICEETDRIVGLVDKMDAFSDGKPVERDPINIHSVLNHVKQLATAGFARHIKFIENYDPSLPPVYANRDQLIQILLNLVKNAAEAISERAIDGEIEFTTAYRPGVRVRGASAESAVGLPLEVRVRDNGPGVPAELLPHLFEPFVSNKVSGTGLGLALVAKLVGDHGGIIECDSRPRRTVFKLLLPASDLPALDLPASGLNGDGS